MTSETGVDPLPTILFVAPTAYVLGGVQIWLSDLVRALQADAHWRVKVALPSGQHHRLARFQDAYPHLDAVPLLNPTGSVAGRRRAITAMLLRERPNLVVGVNIADLYPAMRRARRAGFAGKVVFTLHAVAADLLADIAAEADQLDGVIATNRLSCQLIAQGSDVPPQRIHYAPYGVAWPSPALAFRAAHQEVSQPLRIAWVGRFEQEQKRIHDIPAILTALDAAGCPYHLTLAGDGPEREWITQALQPWLDRGSVTITPALSGREVLEQIYPSHQVLLITSRWETGPIVAWEAMAAGLAVVSSTYVGSGREQALQHRVNALLFPVGDGQAAAGALLELRSGDLRQQLVQAGRQLVQRRYTASLSHQAWKEAFQRILDQPARSSVQPEPSIPASGRLDRMLGPQLAERLRRVLRLSYAHAAAGDEWPHTNQAGCDDQALLRLAEHLDHGERA